MSTLERRWVRSHRGLDAVLTRLGTFEDLDGRPVVRSRRAWGAPEILRALELVDVVVRDDGGFRVVGHVGQAYVHANELWLSLDLDGATCPPWAVHPFLHGEIAEHITDDWWRNHGWPRLNAQGAPRNITSVELLAEPRTFRTWRARHDELVAADVQAAS